MNLTNEMQQFAATLCAIWVAPLVVVPSAIVLVRSLGWHPFNRQDDK